MDDELKALAAAELRSAFWRDFSSLVNKYLKASEGLDLVVQKMGMQDLTSVYGTDLNADPDEDIYLNIWTWNGGSKNNTTSHQTIIGALEHPGALEVYVQGRKAFERQDGEWYYVN